MILNRLGNKEKITPKILPYFPPHNAYIEPFFGCGGLFFYKPKSRYNFLNDIDDDVYNLFRQILDNREELIYWLDRIPITETQFFEWADGKKEITTVMNAVRFLILSNYGLYGKSSTVRHCMSHPKNQILKMIDHTFKVLRDCHFLCVDFRDFFKRIDYRNNVDQFFCYCDPPYLETDDNYSHSFLENDSVDLFNLLQETGMKWAMSEFDHPFILQQVADRNLYVHNIGERTNLKNVRRELLITNYIPSQLKLFS